MAQKINGKNGCRFGGENSQKQNMHIGKRVCLAENEIKLHSY
jgi:hypothetical protein